LIWPSGPTDASARRGHRAVATHAAGQGSLAAPVQRSRRREHEDDEGRSSSKKDGGVAYQVGWAPTRWRMGRHDGVSSRALDDGGEVLQHGGVEGGKGGRLNEEEEGRRVGSLEEGGTAGVAALRPNSGEGRGSRCLSTLWTGLWC
jgi:hypothetical protein